MGSINLLLPDQLQQLRALERAVAAMPDFVSASQLLVDRLAAVLNVRAAVLDRRRMMPYLLPRRLARAVHPTELHQTIVDACAVAAGAASGSLALVDADRKFLSIVATHGYAPVLVRHLRFGPGQDIIGTVFRTGRGLRD